MNKLSSLLVGMAVLATLPLGTAALAQASGGGTVTLEVSPQGQRPKARPDALVPPTAEVAPPAPDAAEPAAQPQRDPTKGAVTNKPLPRFVSLKGSEGNARRGPSLTHRIDWVFTNAGMPLRITAEHENWRRVEDSEGMGGWVHYALLSSQRSVMVTVDMAEFHTKPDPQSNVVFQAEQGVIGWLLECEPDWCRIKVSGEKGWTHKSALWGADPGEIVE